MLSQASNIVNKQRSTPRMLSSFFVDLCIHSKKGKTNSLYSMNTLRETQHIQYLNRITLHIHCF